MAFLFDDNPKIMDENVLSLELCSARDLTEGYDIICKIELDTQKYKTTSQKSVNPVWNTKYDFDITDIPASALLIITVEGVGYITNTTLGVCQIPVSRHREVRFSYAQKHWFPLSNTKKKGGQVGEICIKIGVNHKNMSDKYTKNYDEMTCEDIYEEANVLADESNSGVHRTLKILEQTEDIGYSSINTLYRQSDQIDKMQTDMISVKNNISESERKINSIESIGGT